MRPGRKRCGSSGTWRGPAGSLAIAGIGVYGVLSFSLTQELGIRAALGATPARLLFGVLGSGIAAAALGVAIGVGLALVVSDRLGPLLFQTSPREPMVLVGAGLVVLTIGTLASLVPGLRATRIDPMRAWRAE